jgi:hypothetical protein
MPKSVASILRSGSLLAFVTLAQGYTTFNTKCSTPETSTNFVSSPDSRGTLDILWSCAFMIIACTWTIQHLNVPEQREGRDPGWRGDLKWRLKGTWQTTKWMLITIIAPELIVGKAWGEMDDANHDLQVLKEFSKQDGVPWSMTHSLFANMGGFVIRFNVDRLENSVNDTATQTTKQEKRVDGQQHDYVQDSSDVGCLEPDMDMEKAQAKSVIEPLGKLVNPARPYNNPFHLNGPQIIELRRSGLLSRLPYITVQEINDKSKSDSMVRLIAIVQIVWTVVQIITRAVRHLAISQLEIAVIAFAVCAIITYALDWSKPKGVQVPCTLLQCRNNIPTHICTRLDKPAEGDQDFIALLASFFPEKQNPGGALSNHNKLRYSSANDFGVLTAATVFGVLHLTAWNFIFPNRTEKILWRVASLICSTYPLLWILIILSLGLVVESRNEPLSWRLDLFIGILYILFIMLYIFARLFLIVEIFRTLFFLPPDAYTGTWATNIPHIA